MLNRHNAYQVTNINEKVRLICAYLAFRPRKRDVERGLEGEDTVSDSDRMVNGIRHAPSLVDRTGGAGAVDSLPFTRRAWQKLLMIAVSLI
jgi:hypothetical protein